MVMTMTTGIETYDDLGTILRNFQVILGNWAGESSPHAWLKIMTQDFQVAECDVSRMIK